MNSAKSELQIGDGGGRRGAGPRLQKLIRHEVNITPFFVLPRTGKLRFGRSREVALVCVRYENVSSQFQIFLSRRNTNSEFQWCSNMHFKAKTTFPPLCAI